MKSMVKKSIRGQQGAALILVLVVLLVGGLIAGGLLQHMGAGLLSGEVYARRTAELYAADAGVEDAIWKVQTNNLQVGTDGWSEPWHLTTNDRSVTVSVYREDLDPTCGEELVYRILATAMTEDGGVASIPGSTTVEAYLTATYMDFSSLLDNAMVSNTSITIYNGVLVTGNVTSGGTIEDKTKSGDINGTITKGAKLDWPTAEQLSAYYLDQVRGAVQYDGDTLLDLEGNSCPPGPIYKTIDRIEEAVYWPDGLGPLKVNGTLGITSSDNRQVLTLMLNDTLYVTGNTLIGQTGQDFILDLNGQTIFVESDSTSALTVGVKCSILGPGCIIAIGDVYFAPRGDVGSEDEYVLVMSIEGTTLLQPSGTFYGCIAGNLAVDAKSGVDAAIVNTGFADAGDLNFPTGVGDDPSQLPPVVNLRIDSWEITQQ